MAICPKCGEKIERLDVMVTRRDLCRYRDGDFDNEENIGFDIDYWKCPACHAVLDIEPNMEAADGFLMV